MISNDLAACPQQNWENSPCLTNQNGDEASLGFDLEPKRRKSHELTTVGQEQFPRKMNGFW
jgi:hypothetical protein